jgi:hypothetical protein
MRAINVSFSLDINIRSRIKSNAAASQDQNGKRGAQKMQFDFHKGFRIQSASSGTAFTSNDSFLRLAQLNCNSKVLFRFGKFPRISQPVATKLEITASRWPIKSLAWRDRFGGIAHLFFHCGFRFLNRLLLPGRQTIIRL